MSEFLTSIPRDVFTEHVLQRLSARDVGSLRQLHKAMRDYLNESIFLPLVNRTIAVKDALMLPYLIHVLACPSYHTVASVLLMDVPPPLLAQKAQQIRSVSLFVPQLSDKPKSMVFEVGFYVKHFYKQFLSRVGWNCHKIVAVWRTPHIGQPVTLETQEVSVNELLLGVSPPAGKQFIAVPYRRVHELCLCCMRLYSASVTKCLYYKQAAVCFRNGTRFSYRPQRSDTGLRPHLSVFWSAERVREELRLWRDSGHHWNVDDTRVETFAPPVGRVVGKQRQAEEHLLQPLDVMQWNSVPMIDDLRTELENKGGAALQHRLNSIVFVKRNLSSVQLELFKRCHTGKMVRALIQVKAALFRRTDVPTFVSGNRNMHHDFGVRQQRLKHKQQQSRESRLDIKRPVFLSANNKGFHAHKLDHEVVLQVVYFPASPLHWRGDPRDYELQPTHEMFVEHLIRVDSISQWRQPV